MHAIGLALSALAVLGASVAFARHSTLHGSPVGNWDMPAFWAGLLLAGGLMGGAIGAIP